MHRTRPQVPALWLLALMFLFSACRRAPSPGGGPDPEAIILRIGTADPVRSANILLDSHLAMLAHLSHPPLLRMDSAGRIRGLAAAGADVSPDLSTWTLTMRPDLRWSDGHPVSAEDAAFTLQYLQDHYPPASWMKNLLASAAAVTPRTLLVRTARPYSRLDMDLTTYKILPRHIWREIPDPFRTSEPGLHIGCGPFVIQTVDLERGWIRFIKNPFWPGPAPRIDEIEIHIFKNRDVLTLALEKGDVDTTYRYADSFPYANLERIRRRSDIELLEKSAAGLIFLGFNLKKAPMSDLRFREAVGTALDHEEIVRLYLLGYGRVPDRGLIPDSLPHHQSAPSWKYNPGRAASLLDAAGWRDHDGDGLRDAGSGKDRELVLLSESSFLRLAELVRGQLRAAGLPVVIKSVDGSTWTALKDAYRYDLILAKTSPWGLNMHAGWATGYFDSRRSGEGVLHTVDAPDFHELCDGLLAAPDEAARAALARRVREHYARRLPAVALCWNSIVVPHNRRFSGWVWDPLYGFFNQESFLRVQRADR